MAAYNFPNSPSDGDTVTSNGITYTYSSSKTRWDGAAASGSSTTVYATIDLLPLSGASTGDQAYVSGNNRLYIWNGSGWYNIALINTTPSISGASSSYDLAIDGTATTVTITATDPEGIPITYSIASDTSGNVATVTQGTGANTNVFTITPTTNTANAGTFSLTFRASDGVNIATAVSEFTLFFSVANSNYTTALITSVGANNAVNNSFDDASTNNHTITANGNVTQNTFSPYRHGGYSTYFDGSGDYFSASLTSDFNVGTNSFTVEFWAYLDATGQFHPVLGLGADSSNGYLVDINSSNNVRFLAHIGGSWGAVITGSTALSANQWYHIAVVRDGNDFDIYLNGSSDAATVTNTGSITNPSGGNQVSVGGYQLASNAWRYFNGYISDLRFVNGTAVYPANFTPLTARLTAVTNTKLLTCHLPYLADGSTNSHSITVNGDAKTEPFSPYDHAGYSTANNGGSMYFDGSGDWLSVSDGSWITLGSSDFTIECWAYNSVTSGSRQDLFGQGNSSGQAFSISTELYINSNRTVGGGVYIGAQAYLTSTATIPVNTWTHIALARDGTTLRLYINGVQSATASVGTGTVTDQSTDFSIGRVGEYNGLYFNGNISDFRFVKGTCVYPSGTTFTPPTAPLTAITNTSLLLNGTDAGIIDKSQSVKTLTLNGDVKSSTTQSKYLTSSMYFDGTGDYISIPVEDGFEFGTGDFTIEMWFWYTGTIARYPIILGNGISGSGIYCGWAVFTAGNVLKLERYTGSQTTVTFGSFTAAADTWHHLAIARSGTTIRGFINGTQVGSDITNSVSYNAHNTNPLNIGYGVDGGGTHQWSGYMSDVRITKGLARYTSNFTAPTAALQG